MFVHKQIMPAFAESVSSGEITELFIKKDQIIKEGDTIAVIDIEKSTIELFAEKSGKITELNIKEGDVVKPGLEYLVLDDTVVPEAKAKVAPKKEAKVESVQKEAETLAAPTPVQQTQQEQPIQQKQKSKVEFKEVKSDFSMNHSSRKEVKEKISVLRRKIAGRLKASQNTNALLTTFNEIDMGHIIDVRKKFKDEFIKKHDIKLGFMGFFLKASAYALESYPIVNSVIDGHEILHRNYVDISVAVSGPKGLLVPVVRDVSQKTVADIEKDIFN